MLAASVMPCCSRGNEVVALLLCWTKSLNPCGSCPSLDEVGERGIAGSILSVDISNLSILVAAVVALAEPSCIKRRPGAEVDGVGGPLEPEALGRNWEAGRQRGEAKVRPEGLTEDCLRSISPLTFLKGLRRRGLWVDKVLQARPNFKGMSVTDGAQTSGPAG